MITVSFFIKTIKNTHMPNEDLESLNIINHLELLYMYKIDI